MLADRRFGRLASLASRLAAVVPRHVCAPRLPQGCCQIDERTPATAAAKPDRPKAKHPVLPQSTLFAKHPF